MFLKFDAFIFKVSLHFDLVCSFFESLDYSLEATSPVSGYRYAYTLSRGGNIHGRVQWGGDNVGDDVYVNIMGSDSGLVRDAVIAAGWCCSLLRADIALDFDGEQYFDKLASDLVAIAKKRALKTSTVGDWIQKKEGRTLYVGSRTSVFMMRLYEKYKQKNIDTHGEKTVRLELEIKPVKTARKKSFLLSPLDLVSSSRSFSEIYQKYFKLTDGLTMNQIKKESDHERALSHMIKQYQNTIKKQLEICNGSIYDLFQSLIEHKEWKN